MTNTEVVNNTRPDDTYLDVVFSGLPDADELDADRQIADNAVHLSIGRLSIGLENGPHYDLTAVEAAVLRVQCCLPPDIRIDNDRLERLGILNPSTSVDDKQRRTTGLVSVMSIMRTLGMQAGCDIITSKTSSNLVVPTRYILHNTVRFVNLPNREYGLPLSPEQRSTIGAVAAGTVTLRRRRRSTGEDAGGDPVRSIEWQTRGLCRDEDTSTFFPEGSGKELTVKNEKAKAICRRCPVLPECREWALPRKDEAGILAAMTEADRRRERKRLTDG